jgi:hypothetical protein
VVALSLAPQATSTLGANRGPRPIYIRFRCVGSVLNVSTFKRHNVILVIVPQLKRATIYFDPSLHKALRVKAAHTDRSLSELVNAAVRQTLAEDAQDLAIFAERAKEPALSFEDVLKDLKRRGKL